MYEKAMLVIKMPSRCMECSLFKKMIDNCNYCMATNRIIVDIELKTNWCPLKPIPKKKGLSNELPMYDTDNHYEQGYNACIDEIMEE